MSYSFNVKERLEEVLEKYGISQNRAAKDIGYAAANISTYRNNKYEGNVDALEDAIVKWIARVEQAYARKKVAIMETDALNKINNAIAIAHAEKDIALIVDDAGGGKTSAAKWYVEKNPRTAIYIEVVKGMGHRILTQEIARQLGLEGHAPYHALVQNTAAALSDRDMVVILDEADSLRKDALEFSRRLVNDLGHSGLVLIGLPRLTGEIQNLSGDHHQLESRIGVYLPLNGLTRKDAHKIAKSVWVDVEDEVINAILRIAQKDVRQFTKIIERCQNTMAVNKLEKADLDVVEVAASMVIRRKLR